MDRHPPQNSVSAFLHLFPYKMHWKNCYFCSLQRTANWHISRKMLFLFAHSFHIPNICLLPWLPHYSLGQRQLDCSLPSWSHLVQKGKERWKRQWVLHPRNHTFLHSRARPWITQGGSPSCPMAVLCWVSLSHWGAASLESSNNHSVFDRFADIFLFTVHSTSLYFDDTVITEDKAQNCYFP